MVLAIDPLYPTETIATAGELIRAAIGKGHTGALLHLGLEGLDTDALQGVLGLGILAVDPVAPVALGGDHSCRHRQGVLLGNKAKVVGLAREGLLLAVSHGKAPAHQHVKAHQLAVFGNGHKIEIVGVDVDIVVRRDHDRGLELARQVVGAEDRLLVRPQLLAVQPDLGIGAGLGQQMLGDGLGPLVGFLMQLGLHRIAGAQHVAVYIPCRGYGVHAVLVQGLVHQLDIGLEHTVELEGLARGQTDTAIQGMVTGKFVDGQPLSRGDDATGHTGTQHDVMQRLQLLLGALGTDVAVILLIHAVKADQLEVIAVEAAGERILQILLYGASQKVALAL